MPCLPQDSLLGRVLLLRLWPNHLPPP
jgi:hypothetical protein